MTGEINAKLKAAYSEDGVKVAFSQMFPTKAPGSESFVAHFFQKHWNMVDVLLL